MYTKSWDIKKSLSILRPVFAAGVARMPAAGALLGARPANPVKRINRRKLLIGFLNTNSSLSGGAVLFIRQR
jgi:hypothetical protein